MQETNTPYPNADNITNTKKAQQAVTAATPHIPQTTPEI